MNNIQRSWPIAALILIIAISLALFFYDNQFSTDRHSGNDETVIKSNTSSNSVMNNKDVTMSPLVSPVSVTSPLTTKPIITPVSPDTIQVMVQKAVQFQQNGDNESAIDKANEVLAADPNSFLALNVRGSANLALSNYEEAIEDYSAAINLEPFFPHAFYNRGRVYRLIGQYDLALADLQKSIDLSRVEFSYRAFGNIGLIYHAQGNYDKALEAFENSIENNTENRADVFYYRGETYAAMKNYQAAIIDYQAAVDRFADYDAAYRSLSYAYLKSKRIEEAQDALNTALEISPNNPEAIFYQALIHLAKGQIQKAEDAVTKGLDLIDTLPADERLKTLSRINGYLKNNTKEDQVNKQAASELLERLPEK